MRLTLHLFKHTRPQPHKIRDGFACRKHILDLDAGDTQAQHRGERGHAMIGIRVHYRTMQSGRRHRMDGDAVLQLLSNAANATNLSDQRSQTVRFVAAQMTDAMQCHVGGSQRSQRCDTRSNLAGSRHVERPQTQQTLPPRSP